MASSISKWSLVPSMSWPMASMSWASPVLLAFNFAPSKAFLRDWFLLSLSPLTEFPLHLIKSSRTMRLDHMMRSVEIFCREFRVWIHLTIVAQLIRLMVYLRCSVGRGMRSRMVSDGMCRMVSLGMDLMLSCWMGWMARSRVMWWTVMRLWMSLIHLAHWLIEIKVLGQFVLIACRRCSRVACRWRSIVGWFIWVVRATVWVPVIAISIAVLVALAWIISIRFSTVKVILLPLVSTRVWQGIHRNSILALTVWNYTVVRGTKWLPCVSLDKTYGRVLVLNLLVWFRFLYLF